MARTAPSRTLRLLVGACVITIVAGCEREEIEAPFAGQPARITVSYRLPASTDAGGPLEAFEKANRLGLRLRDAESTRYESSVDFNRAGDTDVRMDVRLRRAREEMQFDMEVLRSRDALFRGTASVELRAGRTTPVSVDLDPVVAAVVAPDSVTLDAWGDTLRLRAAAVFATGDTIDGVALRWTALSGDIVDLDSAGVLVTRKDGSVRLVVHAGDFADTIAVRVAAIVTTVAVTPASAAIPIGGSQRFSATPTDRRGNVIPGRAIRWSSTDTTVVRIDASGIASGIRVGDARVTATVDAATGEVAASGVPGVPLTDSLRASVTGPGSALLQANVTANGATTSTWFEWSSPGVVPSPSLTLLQNIGALLEPVPVSAILQGLRPNTQYVVRIHAINSAGQTVSDSVLFITPSIGPIVRTLGTTGSGASVISLLGDVNPNGATTAAWFQYSMDSGFATYDSTSIVTVNGFARTEVSAIIPLGPPGTTWFYRILGRSQGGLALGATLSFTVPNPMPTPPTVITLPPTGVQAGGRATFNASVNPNGSVTTVFFEWGTSPDPSTFTATASQAIGGGNAFVSVARSMTGLPLEHTIYYRAVANAGGTLTAGAVISFHR